MRRRIGLAVCVMVAGLTMFGCGKSENTESNSIGGAEVKENSASHQNDKTVLKLDDIMNAPATDEQYFTYRETEGGVIVLSCTCEDDIIVLPEKIDGKTVIGIDTNLFAYNATSARGIYIANTVAEIPERAFAAIDNLEILVLGTGIKVIEHNSISGDDNLKVVSILSNQLEKLGDLMVVSCPVLETIYFAGDCNEVTGIIGAAAPTIYGPANSNIEKYAKEEGLTFIAQ